MKNADKSAFSRVGRIVAHGLTKREYFAALAMQGIVSNQPFLINLNAEPKDVARACIEIADEVLKQLENK